MQATKEKNEKARGCKKTKVLKNLEFVDFNGELQPISNSARQMSSLIGCLAWDLRKLSFDYINWKKIPEEY